jgi:hypothetical protein
MTKPEYILEFMKDGDFRFFNVTNGYDNDVIRQLSPTTIEDSIERLHKFFNNTSGMFRVKLYTSNELKRDGNPRQEPQIFEVQLNGQPISIGGFDDFEPEPPAKSSRGRNIDSDDYDAFPAGFNPGMGAPGGIFGVETYMSQTREIMELKEKIKDLTNKLEFMVYQHKMELERLNDKHAAELKEAKDSNALLGQGLGMLMNKMGVGE